MVQRAIKLLLSSERARGNNFLVVFSSRQGMCAGVFRCGWGLQFSVSFWCRWWIMHSVCYKQPGTTHYLHVFITLPFPLSTSLSLSLSLFISLSHFFSLSTSLSLTLPHHTSLYLASLTSLSRSLSLFTSISKGHSTSKDPLLSGSSPQSECAIVCVILYSNLF